MATRASSRRLAHEPAYVLHHYDWSETSLILEVFTRGQGRVALVAKGAKRPSSGFRPVLLPLQPLVLSFGGDGEIRTLKGADWAGGHVMPTGEALLSGYYVNELVMRLLARDDAHPRLFAAYAATVEVLAGPLAAQAAVLSAALRAFELVLLRETGHLPALDRQTQTQEPLDPAELYALVSETGLRDASEDEPALAGSLWLELHAALEQDAPFAPALRASAGASGPLRPQLQRLLNYHCGAGGLRTRQMMRDLQDL